MPALPWARAQGAASASAAAAAAIPARRPARLLRLPSWHEAAAVSVSAPAPAAAASSAPPRAPRAARSPADLRAARVMCYLLGGLRFRDAGARFGGGEEDADAGAAAGAGAGDGAGDGLALSRALRGARAAASAHARAEAACAREAFWSVLCDGRGARACVRGAASPAYALGRCLPLRVPAADMQICAAAAAAPERAAAGVGVGEGEHEGEGAGAGAGWLAAGCGVSRRGAELCAAAVGQLVGICASGAGEGGGEDADGGAASARDLLACATPAMRAALQLSSRAAPASPSAPARARALAGCELECLGVGFVRCFDALAGVLHVVTPLSLRALAGAGGRARGGRPPASAGPLSRRPADTLVLWAGAGGAHDVPAPLLFRGAAEGGGGVSAALIGGDAFAFPAASVLASASASAGTGPGPAVGEDEAAAAAAAAAEGAGAALGASSRSGAAGRRGGGRPQRRRLAQ